MADYSHRNVPVMNDHAAGPGFCADLPGATLARLASGEIDPFSLMDLAGQVDNSLMSELVCSTPAVEQAPAPVTPRERPRHDEIRKQNGALDPAIRAAAALERAKYTGLLAIHRAEVSQAAATDRAQGLSTEAVARDDRMTALEDAHDQFTSVDLGNGLRVSTPYFMRPPDNAQRGVEQNGFKWDQWMDRRDSSARADANRALGSGPTAGAFRAAKGAKAGAGQLGDVMRATLAGRLWEKRTTGEGGDKEPVDPAGGSGGGLFDAKRREFTAPDASDATRDAASVAAFARVAGFGTDCAGLVQHVLTGAGILPEGLYNGEMTGVGNLTSGLGESVGGGKAGRGNKPVDSTGQLDIQAGDTLNIGAGGHIGVVMDAFDTGGEIVMQLAHSTANQDVYNGSHRVATQPEGARDDTVVYDKKTGRWRAVDSAWSDADLNAEYGGFYRMDDEKIDAQVALDAEKAANTAKKRPQMAQKKSPAN